MDNDLTVQKQEQELQLQEKYPAGTRGRIGFYYLADSDPSSGWPTEAIAVIESTYISGAGDDCLTAIIENGRCETVRFGAERFEILDEDQT